MNPVDVAIVFGKVCRSVTLGNLERTVAQTLIGKQLELAGLYRLHGLITEEELETIRAAGAAAYRELFRPLRVRLAVEPVFGDQTHGVLRMLLALETARRR